MIEQSNQQVPAAPIGWAFGPVLEEAFSRDLIGGLGDGKLQAGLVAAFLAVIILMVAMNVS